MIEDFTPEIRKLLAAAETNEQNWDNFLTAYEAFTERTNARLKRLERAFANYMQVGVSE